VCDAQIFFIEYFFICADELRRRERARAVFAGEYRLH
jgi:hypothetical protein